MARSERGRLTDRMRCKMDKSWAVLLAGDNGSPELCQHTAFACGSGMNVMPNGLIIAKKPKHI